MEKSKYNVEQFHIPSNNLPNILGKTKLLSPTVSDGMERLPTLEKVYVKQRFGKDFAKNQYEILNSTGTPLFAAREKSNLCCQFWCSAARGFSMIITDNSNKEVIRLERPNCRCATPWGPACIISLLTCCLIPNWCCNLCGDSCAQTIKVRYVVKMSWYFILDFIIL